MQTLSIGDIHGRDHWQKVDPVQYDYVIFVGDYFDSWDVPNPTMLDNMRNILEFKKSYDNVILLLGNHDIHYLYSDESVYRGSGYRAEIALAFQELLIHHQYLMQVAFQIENVLWTHAGVNKVWAKTYLEDLPLTKYAVTLNEMFKVRKTRMALADIGASRGGFFPTGGPFWSDHRKDNIQNPIPGLIQIYGHTEVADITIVEEKDYELINIDCLGRSNCFFEYCID